MTIDHRKLAFARLAGAKSVEIPIPVTPWPILTVVFPMTEETWNEMINMLNLMKASMIVENVTWHGAIRPFSQIGFLFGKEWETCAHISEVTEDMVLGARELLTEWLAEKLDT